MPVAESSGLITQSVQSVVPTDVDVSRLANITRSEARHQWQRLIDDLIVWAVWPERIDDEYTPPSRETIGLASIVARRLRDQGEPAPNRVVAGADGSVVFESQESAIFESINVSAGLEIEYRKFVNGRLTSREKWEIEQTS